MRSLSHLFKMLENESNWLNFYRPTGSQTGILLEKYIFDFGISGHFTWDLANDAIGEAFKKGSKWLKSILMIWSIQSKRSKINQKIMKLLRGVQHFFLDSHIRVCHPNLLSWWLNSTRKALLDWHVKAEKRAEEM